MNLKNRINNFLSRFNVALHGTGYLQALAKGEFSKDEYDYFKTVFGDKPITIFDAGANRGLTIQKFLEIFPSVKIYAFEPIEDLCKELFSKFAGNDAVKIFNYGVSHEEAIQTININKSIDTSSLLLSKKTGLNSDASVETLYQQSIKVTSLDKICREENLQKIHILKLDIQGSELNALQGAENLLRNQSIDLVYTEAYFVQQYVNQPLFYDIANYLTGFGYVLQDIYNPKYGQNKIAWCDAVFIKDQQPK